jgi:tetratricopeptide (TPR) repeat protein
LLMGAALLAAACAAYSPAARNAYVWDDDDHVYANPTLRSVSGLRDIWFDVGATPQYYPLTHSTYWLEYRLWGDDPKGYHVVNVFLHGLSALLLWRVLRTLKVPGSWFGAAIFALHPVHVESVAWVSERKNVLSGLFYLGAVLAYIRYSSEGSETPATRKAWGWYVLSFLLFTCAMLSKTIACTLPLALALVTWWKLGRLSRRRALELIPFLALGLILGLQTVRMEASVVGARGAPWDLSVVERALVAGRALWFYAGKLVWPLRLSFVYPRWQISGLIWWQYAYPLAAAAVVVLLWLVRSRTGRGPLAGVLFFVITLAPALGFFSVFPMQFSFVADHFQYLASAGLIGLLVAVVATASRRVGGSARAVAAVTGVLALAGLAGLTWSRTHAFRDAASLWRDTLAKNPDAWLAHVNLGNIVRERGGLQAAMAHYREALRLRPDCAEAHSNLCLVLTEAGQAAQAAQHGREAVRLRPDFGQAHNNLGLALLRLGVVDGAAGHFEAATRLLPDDEAAWLSLGAAREEQGRPEEAAACHMRALTLCPEDPRGRYNLGRCLVAVGRVAEGARQLEMAVSLDPGYSRAANELATVRAVLERLRNAMDRHAAELQAHPDDFVAHLNLGLGYRAVGDHLRATEHLEEAVRLEPGSAEAHQALGTEWFARGDAARSVACFEEALRADPAMDVARRLLALLEETSDGVGQQFPLSP